MSSFFCNVIFSFFQREVNMESLLEQQRRYHEERERIVDALVQVRRTCQVIQLRIRSGHLAITRIGSCDHHRCSCSGQVTQIRSFKSGGYSRRKRRLSHFSRRGMQDNRCSWSGQVRSLTRRKEGSQSSEATVLRLPPPFWDILLRISQN